jgi:formate dehydrogenase subunit gamma
MTTADITAPPPRPAVQRPVITHDGKIKRFDVHQIIQHIGLMTSFILLVLTGLPLKFSEAGASQWWTALWGGIDVLRTTHRVAAWMMFAVCIYHIVYLLITILVLKRPFPIRIVPNRSDIDQLFGEIAYFLGIRKHRPKVDRFNWKEKFDYWAIFWGMPVMFGSGFILMFPVLATKFLPGWVVPTALVAHSHEAMLALLWIVGIHIFFSHFSPSVFPMNTVIFTGKMKREKYREEHPLEYDRIMQRELGIVPEQTADIPKERQEEEREA